LINSPDKQLYKFFINYWSVFNQLSTYRIDYYLAKQLFIYIKSMFNRLFQDHNRLFS